MDSDSDNTPSYAVYQAASQELYGIATLGTFAVSEGRLLRRGALPSEEARYRQPILLWQENGEQALGIYLDNGS